MTTEIKVPRNFSVVPTDDKLKADAIRLVQFNEQSWDGEVEMLVILSRRAGPLNLAWAGSITDREKQVRLLQEVLKREPVSVKGKGKGKG